MQTEISPDLVTEIRLAYRLAKAAEITRIGIDQRLVSFVRVYLTAWTPDGEKYDREKANKQALRVIKTIHKGYKLAVRAAAKGGDMQTWSDFVTPHADDLALCDVVSEMVINMEGARAALEHHNAARKKQVEELARQLPAISLVNATRGFSAWHLGVIVGEFGDLTDNAVPEAERVPGKRYSGVRRIYKRLGLAPDDAYAKGTKPGAGRMVPRSSRGRIIGIIFDPLMKSQLAAERGPEGQKLKQSEKGLPENIPGHATGAYGKVYRDVRARHTSQGGCDRCRERLNKSGKLVISVRGHSHALARRAMIKALIHDVHRTWHGLAPDYTFSSDDESHVELESQYSCATSSEESSHIRQVAGRVQSAAALDGGW